jgi:muramidase (phage lysozyme)
MGIRLSGAVGKKAGQQSKLGNIPAEVGYIQQLLNLKLKNCSSAYRFGVQLPLAVDQRCGKKTCAAIRVYQQETVRLSQPDETVDPGGKTYQSLIQGIPEMELIRLWNEEVARSRTSSEYPIGIGQLKQAQEKRIALPSAQPGAAAKVAALELLLKEPSLWAFLDMISWAEGTRNKHEEYNVCFGGAKFTDYSHHPDIKLEFTATINGKAVKQKSGAAGRYQFLADTWERCRKTLYLPDFGPCSQNIAAMQLLVNRRVAKHLQDADLSNAINEASREWASLPVTEKGAGGTVGQSRYGQRARSFDDLQKAYDAALKNPSQRPVL